MFTLRCTIQALNKNLINNEFNFKTDFCAQGADKVLLKRKKREERLKSDLLSQ